MPRRDSRLTLHETVGVRGLNNSIGAIKVQSKTLDSFVNRERFRISPDLLYQFNRQRFSFLPA